MLSTILKFMTIVILFIPFTFCSVLILGPVITGFNEASQGADTEQAEEYLDEVK